MTIPVKTVQDAVHVLAFNKAFKDDSPLVKKARAMVEPGDYEVAGEFEVAGTVSIGEETVAPHNRLNSAPKLLATVMAHLRKTEKWSSQKTSAFLTKVIDQAVDHPEEVLKEDLKAITKQREIASKRLVAKLDPETKKGQVRFNGQISKPKRHKVSRTSER